MLDLKRIGRARKRINEVAYKTPFAYAPILSEMTGLEIYLKKENLQRTGSFKLRGAFNKIAVLMEKGHCGGVVAASAGNHAQGVAFASRYFGIKGTIVMPESTPLTKVMGVRDLGAEVILHGSNYDEAYAYAVEYAAGHGRDFVHPFADEEVMAGQGSIMLEMLEEQPDLDAVVIPVGGGGLISGCAVAAKALSPEMKVIGIAAAGAPAMKQSFDAGRPIDTTDVRTIADGIAVRDTSAVTLKYILANVDNMDLVCEDEIASAILFLLERQKLTVEGAGAVGVAAVMHGHLENLSAGSKVGIVLSGGNIDVTMLSLIIEKGLVKSYRKMKLVVTLIDKPGALERLAGLMRSVQANIVQIGYDRTSTDLEFGDAHVSVALETKGAEHQEQIRIALKEHGFPFREEH
jgi:threonine dehydratase